MRGKIFLWIMMLFMLASTASALKTFDPNVPAHGEIKVKDWLFFSKADYRLLNYECSVIDCWAEGEFKLYKKTHLFQDLKFIDVAGKEGSYKDYKFFIQKNKTINTQIPKYYESCEDLIQQNGTASLCNIIENGSETISKVETYWDEYQKGTDLDATEGRWRIQVKREPNKKTDFILEAQGYDLNEWAWWNTTWNYKQLITINFSNSANLTNHWINFTYVGSTGKFLSDFSDLRFISYDETKELVWKYSQKNSTEIQIWLYAEDSTQNISRGSINFWAYYGASGYVNPGWNTTFYYGDTFTNKSSHGWTQGSQAAGLFTISGNDLFLDANSSAISTIYSNLPPSVANWSNYTINSNATWTGCQANDGSYLFLGLGETGSLPTQKMVGAFLNGRYSGYTNDNFGNGFANLGTNVTNVGVNICNNWITSEVVQTGNRNDSATTRQQTNYWQRDNYASSGFFTNTTTSYQMTNTPAMFAYVSSRWAGNDVKINYLLLSKGIGQQTSYTVGAEIQANPKPTINIYSPQAGLNTTNPSIDFITLVYDNSALLNVSLIINNIYNSTNTSAINNTNYSFNKIFSEGIYNWKIEACDDSFECINSTQRTLIIDSTKPSINISYPLNGSEIQTSISPKNISFNVSVSDNVLLNNCLYYNSSVNLSISCGQNVSINLTEGWKTLIYYANDTAGNLRSNESLFLINYIRPTLNITTPVVENQNNTINLTVYATSINSFAANASYNGTIYPMSVESSNSTYAKYTVTITSPGNISSNQIMPIFVTYQINGIYYNTSTQNQTVLFLTPINVSTNCVDKAMTFNISNEQNLTALFFSVDYNIQFGVGSDGFYKTVYGSITNGTTGVNSFSICINSSISNYTIGRGELQYDAVGNYVQRRYYLFEGSTLSNQSQNVTLYDLADADSTSFLFEASRSDLSPYVGYYLGLLRWYPNLNSYNRVEMAQTDEDGRSIMRVKTEDVDYRVALWNTNGSIVSLQEPTRFACLASPCTYSFDVSAGETDFTSITGVDQDLSFNQTTGVWTYVWNDPSGRTPQMNMSVVRETGLNVGVICTQNGTGATGVMDCDVSGYTGQLRAYVYRTASPAVPIASDVAFVGDTLSSTAADVGLFIAAVLAIAGFFIGIFYPVAGIILQIGSLIPPLYFGSITMSILIGFAIMGVVVIHFMRRALGR